MKTEVVFMDDCVEGIASDQFLSKRRTCCVNMCSPRPWSKQIGCHWNLRDLSTGGLKRCPLPTCASILGWPPGNAVSAVYSTPSKHKEPKLM